MPVAPSEIRALIDAELANVTDQRIVAHIRSLLVEPRPVERTWLHEQSNRTYTCWSVLEDAGTAIAYCSEGPGPRWQWHWGLVSLENRAMGPDNAWYDTLLEAYFEAFAEDLPIWRVFKTRPGGNPVAITGEGEWRDIWASVYAFRKADTASRYDCCADASPFLKARLPSPVPTAVATKED